MGTHDVPLAEKGAVAVASEPQGLTDLFQYRIARLEGLWGSIVTRLCEGEFGITRREWRFLALLQTFGEMTPSTLSVEASLDRGCTSKTLTTMLEKKLINRRPADDDARRARLTLTAKGRRVHNEVFAALLAVNSKIVGAVRADELPRLSASLEAMEVLARQAMASLEGTAHADRRHGGSRKRWETREGARRSIDGDDS